MNGFIPPLIRFHDLYWNNLTPICEYFTGFKGAVENIRDRRLSFIFCWILYFVDDNLSEYFKIQKIMLFGSSIEDKSRSSFEKCRIDRGTLYDIEGYIFRQMKCWWNLENKGIHRNIYFCELQMIYVYVNVPTWKQKLQPYYIFQSKAFYAIRFTSAWKKNSKSWNNILNWPM